MLQSLVRDNYQLATSQQPSGATTFPEDARADLQAAANYWQRYLEAESEKPNATTATYALRVYEPGALNQPKEATRAASIIAEAQNDPNAYLQLVAYAALAKDERTADLAAQKAVELAPKSQRKQVKQQARGASATAAGAASRAADVGLRPATQDWLPATRGLIGRDVNFHIEDEAVDDATHIIELGGEVDLYTAPEFKERMVELIESGKKQIVVDLSKATFIDSTTLGVLVGGVKRLRPAGGSLALVCTDDNITKIFEITGLDRVFPIHSSREEALDAVASGATRDDSRGLTPPGTRSHLAGRSSTEGLTPPGPRRRPAGRLLRLPVRRAVSSIGRAGDS